MTNSTSLAEMANTADYSAMTYNGLLELNVALNWGLMNVKSNLEPKRLEEMSNITHVYVVAMNGYGATKAEIMSCLEKEEMREKPMFSDIHDDVDDQSAPDEAVIIKEEGDGILTLPESPIKSMEDVNDTIDLTVASDENNEEETKEIDSKEPNTDEESISAHNDNKEEENSSEDTPASTASHPYSKVIDILLSLPIQEDTNVNLPYFAEYSFYNDKNGELKYHDRTIKYMSNGDLESFKYAAKRYATIIHKDPDMISTDDYLVYRNSSNELIGIIYNTPEDNMENVKCENLSEESNNDNLSIEEFAEKKKELSKKHAKMRKAMRLLAEYSDYNGVDANRPSYDRCIFKASTGNPEIDGAPRNIEEDVETLSEMISVLETYSKFYYDKCEILSKGNCFALMYPSESRIYVIKVNIPENMKATKTHKKREKVVKTVPASVGEDALISKAVDVAKSMSVGKVVDDKAPYFTKCEFSIGDDKELVEGRPFARNIDTDKLEGIKESHKRCAETYKASYVSCGADYTAYIYNEGKSVCVYCYHCNEAND